MFLGILYISRELKLIKIKNEIETAQRFNIFIQDKIAGIQQKNAALRQELDILKFGTNKQGNIIKSIQESSTTQTKLKDLSLTN